MGNGISRKCCTDLFVVSKLAFYLASAAAGEVLLVLDCVFVALFVTVLTL